MDSLISLFTDAGLKDGVGAWAMWAKQNGDVIRYSGIIRRACDSSNDAELCAIANGLYVLKRRWEVSAQTTILLQSDSTSALGMLQGVTVSPPLIAFKHHGPTRVYGSLASYKNHDIVAYIKTLVAENEWILKTRHVKGHRGTQKPRFAVNTWCDRECTRLLRTHAYGTTP